jgi:hypothetical protein
MHRKILVPLRGRDSIAESLPYLHDIAISLPYWKPLGLIHQRSRVIKGGEGRQGYAGASLGST